jgi:hypothetical protein
VLISRSSQLAFIHVQKTGGISIRNALRRACPDLEEVNPRHQTLVDALASHPELETYLIAGFVRNPWDRLVSWWAMVQGAADRPVNHPHHDFLRRPLWRYLAGFDAFEDFIRDIPTGPFEQFRKPQLDYLTASKREADVIGRSEDIDAGVAELLRRIGLDPVPVPHVNKSKRPASYRDLYGHDTQRIVEQVFQRDIERFGYRF